MFDYIIIGSWWLISLVVAFLIGSWVGWLLSKP